MSVKVNVTMPEDMDRALVGLAATYLTEKTNQALLQKKFTLCSGQLVQLNNKVNQVVTQMKATLGNGPAQKMILVGDDILVLNRRSGIRNDSNCD